MSGRFEGKVVLVTGGNRNTGLWLVKKFVDEDTWNKVQERLVIQEADARWWRDACVQYFQTFSGMPVPSDVAAPEIPLDSLRRRRGNPPTLHQEPAGPSSF